MKYLNLPIKYIENYKNLKSAIDIRLEEFSQVPEEDYFYELCFCILTPQSKAENAYQVVQKLQKEKFLESGFNPEYLLFDKNNYIRFHVNKSKYLLKARECFEEILKILKLNLSDFEKRNMIRSVVLGYGLKEASHFMRNIGYRNLAILDRHILKNLTLCGVFDEIPKICGDASYYKIENKFKLFSKEVGINIDELDLLFWSTETGKILK